MTSAHEQADRHNAIYDHLHETPEFQELRSRYRGFVFPATAAFLVWYLTYVILSMWAHDFMSHRLAGNINVALVFGLLQFVTTFALAWVYSNYANKNLDPLARKLNGDFQEGA